MEFKMTKQQVLDDIKSGKSQAVYYSSQTLWWTHLNEDLKEANKTGKEKQRENLTHMTSPGSNVPEAQQKMMRAHLQRIDDSPIPLDPSGSPLLQIDDPIQWIEKADENPKHFGKHEIDALMKTHHQNSNGWCPSSWESVNQYLDRMKEFEAKAIQSDNNTKSEFEKAIDDNIKRHQEEE